VVLTGSGEVVGGSARSVPGFNLYEAIHSCREHLIGYGGHFAAAGMTMSSENISAFSRKFEEIVSSTIDPYLLIPELCVDTEICFRDITKGFFNIINQMEPYGPGNLRPLFLAKTVSDTGWSKVVKEQHVRFVVRKENITMTGIGFNLAEKFSLIASKKPFDLLFTLDENEWNEQKMIQLKVVDIREAQFVNSN
jgi:single-stranded-DNA-specific exonuclease